MKNVALLSVVKMDHDNRTYLVVVTVLNIIPTHRCTERVAGVLLFLSVYLCITKCYRLELKRLVGAFIE